MNYVKVKATSPHINLSLFVPENEIGKKLKELQELHNKTAPVMVDEYAAFNTDFTKWVNKNVLIVRMRKVRIDTVKKRGIKAKLQPLSNIPTFSQLQATA